jgi:hypothetical protein
VANLLGPTGFCGAFFMTEKVLIAPKGQIADSRSRLSLVEVMVRISVISASTDAAGYRGADVPLPTPHRQLSPLHGQFDLRLCSVAAGTGVSGTNARIKLSKSKVVSWLKQTAHGLRVCPPSVGFCLPVDARGETRRHPDRLHGRFPVTDRPVFL